MNHFEPAAERRVAGGPSLIGSAPAIVAAATAVAYVTLVDDLAASPRRVFIAGWLAALVVVAGTGTWSRSVRTRALLAPVAAVGMLVAGAAGLSTIGVPLGIGGVLLGLGALPSLERAAAERSSVWLIAATLAVCTVLLFAVGLTSTSP